MITIQRKVHFKQGRRTRKELRDGAAVLAREVGRLHGWSGKVWSRRYAAVPVTDEPEAEAERTIRPFSLAQPEVTSKKLPVVIPWEPDVVATAGFWLVTAETVSALA